MEATDNQPDEVTQAALDAVSQAVELADAQERQRRALRTRGPRGIRRIRARLARRSDRARGERRIGTAPPSAVACCGKRKSGARGSL